MGLDKVIKKGSAAPVAGDLIEGGIGIDTVGERIYSKNSSDEIIDFLEATKITNDSTFSDTVPGDLVKVSDVLDFMQTGVLRTDGSVAGGAQTFGDVVVDSITASGGNTIDADTVTGSIVLADVPVDAVFTDTTYVPAVADSAVGNDDGTDGLLSSNDARKLGLLDDVPTAANIAFNNTASGMTAEEMQAAVDELHARTDFVKWAGEWDGSTYTLNQMVIEDGWLGVVNTASTTDHVAPQMVGVPRAAYTGTMLRSVANAKQLVFGNRYDINAGYIQDYRIYCETGFKYVVMRVEDPTGTPVEELLLDFTAASTGWIAKEFTLDTAYSAEFDLIVMVSKPDDIASSFSGDWAYTGTVVDEDPVSGQVMRSNENPDVFRMSYTDNVAADRTTEIQSLGLGDVISNAAGSWRVQSNTNRGTFADIEVDTIIELSSGLTYTFTMDKVNYVDLPYYSEADYWTNNTSPNEGLFVVGQGYENVAVDGTAYGIDITYQEMITSSSWDILSTTDSNVIGGGSGGGVTEFEALVDTPSSYIGSGGLNVKVKASQDGLEYGPPAIEYVTAGTNIVVDDSDPTNIVISTIPNAGASVISTGYYTGDPVVLVAGTFYEVLHGDKGTVAEVSQDVSPNDGQTIFFSQDYIGIAAEHDFTISAGDYTANYTMMIDMDRTEVEVYTEAYLADTDGNVIDSGIAEMAIGNLGVKPLVVITTGTIKPIQDTKATVTGTGVIYGDMDVVVGQRIRHHLAARKVGTAGGAMTVTVYAGYENNTGLNSPVRTTTDNVQNLSNVTGAMTSDALNALYAEQAEKMKWRGGWTQSEYTYNDVVTDGDWLKIVNASAPGGVTTERPAPVNTGGEVNFYNGSSGSAANITATQIVFGNRYNASGSGAAVDYVIKGYRLYTIAGENYTVKTVVDPLGEAIVKEVQSFTATTTGWTEFSVDEALVTSSDVYDIVAIVSQGNPVVTDTVGNWNYRTPKRQENPGNGEIIHSDDDPEIMAVSKTDNDGNDLSTGIEAMAVGDEIKQGGVTWLIQSVTDNGGWVEYTVSPAMGLSTEGVQEFTFRNVVAADITVFSETNYWTTEGLDIQGLQGVDVDYGSIVPNGTAYGIDLLVQEVSISSHWDTLASSESGGTGGDNVTTIIDNLTSTEASYALSANMGREIYDKTIVGSY